jgi:hypothetical protein
VQVGTSPYSSVSRGADYAFTSGLPEGPRIASTVDLPLARRDRSLAFRLSRYGAIPLARQRASHGITHRFRLGLRRYERVCTRNHSRVRQAMCLPDKEFRSRSPHVAMGRGPYLQLFTSRRVGWRMASEDSRNRDGFRWFIVCTIRAMSDSPSIVRWRPPFII